MNIDGIDFVFMLIIYKDITAFWASPSLLSITKQLKFTIVDILEMVNTLREIEKNKDEADEDGCSILSTEESLTKTSIPDTITPNTDCTVPLPLIQQLAYGSFLYFYLFFVVPVTVDVVDVPFVFIICIFHLSVLGIAGKSKQC